MSGVDELCGSEYACVHCAREVRNSLCRADVFDAAPAHRYYMSRVKPETEYPGNELAHLGDYSPVHVPGGRPLLLDMSADDGMAIPVVSESERGTANQIERLRVRRVLGHVVDATVSHNDGTTLLRITHLCEDSPLPYVSGFHRKLVTIGPFWEITSNSSGQVDPTVLGADRPPRSVFCDHSHLSQPTNRQASILRSSAVVALHNAMFLLACLSRSGLGPARERTRASYAVAEVQMPSVLQGLESKGAARDGLRAALSRYVEGG